RRCGRLLAADGGGRGTDARAAQSAVPRSRRSNGKQASRPDCEEHRRWFLAELASVVDAVRCAVEVQREMVERNAAVPEGQRIEFRVGINLGDVIAERGDISVTVSTSRRDWKPWPS